jgi:translation initiation factor eIF-2B subunit epsilon
VDICSPDLLIKYSDNFDYQDMRRFDDVRILTFVSDTIRECRDFIVNEITNIELGSHIYCWTLEDEYAARVMDLKTYHTICQASEHLDSFGLCNISSRIL